MLIYNMIYKQNGNKKVMHLSHNTINEPSEFKIEN